MSYTPPTSGSAVLELEVAYTAPTSGSTILDFTAGTVDGISVMLTVLTMTADGGGFIEADVPMMSIDIARVSSFEPVLPFPVFDATCGAGIAADLPLMTLAIFPMLPGGEIDIDLPELLLSAHLGGDLNYSFPLPVYDQTGAIGHAASVADDLPAFSFGMHGGGYAEIDFPMFVSAMEGSSEVVANIQASIPALSFSGTLISELHGGIGATLPSMVFSIDGVFGSVGVLSAAMKPLSFSGVMLNGYPASISATLPVLSARITGIRSGPAEIDGDFAPMVLGMLGGFVPTGTLQTVLRHDKERVR